MTPAQRAAIAGPVRVEVRENSDGTLDEVVLTVNGECYFHLEQMNDNDWWMGIGDYEGEYVHVNLVTTRAKIHGHWRNEGKKAVVAPPYVDCTACGFKHTAEYPICKVAAEGGQE